VAQQQYRVELNSALKGTVITGSVPAQPIDLSQMVRKSQDDERASSLTTPEVNAVIVTGNN